MTSLSTLAQQHRQHGCRWREVGGEHLRVHFRGQQGYVKRTKQPVAPHYTSEPCFRKSTVSEHY